MAPLAPRTPAAVAECAARSAPDGERRRVHGARLPEDEGRLTLAQSINRTLADVAAANPACCCSARTWAARAASTASRAACSAGSAPPGSFDTLLDEQTVLGLALGSGLSGLLPVPEIQYLAYLHNAEDQLRGEAATPAVLLRRRVPQSAGRPGAGAGLPEGLRRPLPQRQRGSRVLRDIPGLVVAVPGAPARRARRCCARASPPPPSTARSAWSSSRSRSTTSATSRRPATAAGRAVRRAGRWGAQHVPIGAARTWGDGPDLTIVDVRQRPAHGAAGRRPAAREGIGVRVVDLRWLAPLPIDDVLREAARTGRLLVVDETRATGGVSEGLVTGLLEAGFDGRLARIASDDSFVPLGRAAALVLVSEQDVEDAARLLLS